MFGCASRGVYASEVKFLRSALELVPYEEIRIVCGIGDKGFDSVEIMKYLEASGIESVIQVRETFRKEVREEIKKKLEDLAEKMAIRLFLFF